MAKRRVELTEQQQQRNAAILARIEAEREKLFEDTRELQKEWKREASRRRARRRKAES